MSPEGNAANTAARSCSSTQAEAGALRSVLPASGMPPRDRVAPPLRMHQQQADDQPKQTYIDRARATYSTLRAGDSVKPAVPAALTDRCPTNESKLAQAAAVSACVPRVLWLESVLSWVVTCARGAAIAAAHCARWYSRCIPITSRAGLQCRQQRRVHAGLTHACTAHSTLVTLIKVGNR
jgi:hypothetical protein